MRNITASVAEVGSFSTSATMCAANCVMSHATSIACNIALDVAPRVLNDCIAAADDVLDDDRYFVDDDIDDDDNVADHDVPDGNSRLVHFMIPTLWTMIICNKCHQNCCHGKSFVISKDWKTSVTQSSSPIDDWQKHKRSVRRSTMGNGC